MSALDSADRLLGSSGARRRGAGILLSLVSLALVTGAIYAFKSFVPVLSLGVLYVFAVLPVAVLFGRAYAIPVALASAEKSSLVMRLVRALPGVDIRIVADPSERREARPR